MSSVKQSRSFPASRTFKLLLLLLFALKFVYLFNTYGIVKPIQKTTQWMGTLGILLILFSLLWLFKPRLRIIYFMMIDCILTVVSFIDLLFLRFYQDAITLRTLTTAWHSMLAKTTAWSLLKPGDLFLILDFGVLLVGLLFSSPSDSRRIPYRSSTPSKSSALSHLFPPHSLFRGGLFLGRLIGTILFIGIGFGLVAQAYQRLETDQPGITNTFYSKLYIAQSVGNFEFHALDAMRLAKINLQTPDYSVQESASLSNWFKSTHPSSGTNLSSWFGMAKGKNVIVIQVESLQEFVIGKSIQGQEITPNLNRFLKQSLYFDHYYGETWNGGTSDAEFISNVSMFPVSRGSAFVDYPMNHYTSIASTLQNQGYETIALEANLPGFWGMDLMSRSMGFQKVVDADDFIQDQTIGMGLADQSMFTQSANHLEQLKEPFCSFLVTLSSHYPFELPDKEKTLNVGPYNGTLFGHYLQAVHYTDQALGNFLDRLQKDGLLERSIVVIYGDHPAPIPRESKELRSFLGFGAQGLNDYQWLSLQKVPMLIHLPGSPRPQVLSKTGGQIDLFPTLLGLLGEDASQYPVLGHDLLNSTASGLAISRSGALYYENRLYNVPASTVYDLSTGQTLPWKERDPALKLYQDYLHKTDFIFKYDLQEKLLPKS